MRYLYQNRNTPNRKFLSPNRNHTKPGYTKPEISLTKPEHTKPRYITAGYTKAALRQHFFSSRQHLTPRKFSQQGGTKAGFSTPKRYLTRAAPRRHQGGLLTKSSPNRSPDAKPESHQTGISCLEPETHLGGTKPELSQNRDTPNWNLLP